MAIDGDLIGGVVGIVSLVGGGVWGGWKWIVAHVGAAVAALTSRLDAADKRVGDLEARLVARQDEAAKDVQGGIALAHRRIDEVRDLFVRRDEFHREMGALKNEVNGTRADVRDGFKEITARMDRLYTQRSERD